MKLLVIQELDLYSNETFIIGVADSQENAQSRIQNYYGKENCKQVTFNDTGDSSIKHSNVIELNYSFTKPHKIKLIFQWFVVNE
jgi:hypothetical protein